MLGNGNVAEDFNIFDLFYFGLRCTIDHTFLVEHTNLNWFPVQGSSDLFLSDRYQTYSSMVRRDNTIGFRIHRYGNVESDAFLTFVYIC